MAEKKYIVKVPAGKETNDFEFDELQPAFRKFCNKIGQNQKTRIVSYTSTLELPKEMTWGELLNDVISMYQDSLMNIEKINELPKDAEGRYIITPKIHDDFKALCTLMECVTPPVWNTWDELSKIYWKSCIPRMRMLLDEAIVAEN